MSIRAQRITRNNRIRIFVRLKYCIADKMAILVKQRSPKNMMTVPARGKRAKIKNPTFQIKAHSKSKINGIETVSTLRRRWIFALSISRSLSNLVFDMVNNPQMVKEYDNAGRYPRTFRIFTRCILFRVHNISCTRANYKPAREKTPQQIALLRR